MNAADMRTALICTAVTLAGYGIGFLRGLVVGHKLLKAKR